MKSDPEYVYMEFLQQVMIVIRSVAPLLLAGPDQVTQPPPEGTATSGSGSPWPAEAAPVFLNRTTDLLQVQVFRRK